MPIASPVAFQLFSEEEFYGLDYEVMELIFAIHNEFGGFCDEKIYQRELLHRCLEMGFESASTEVPLHVSYRGFSKTYYVDLLVNNGVLYELKTVDRVAPYHRQQALNYLLLAGLCHGKLINMRPASVEYEFVSTTLSPEARHDVRIDVNDWRDVDKDSRWLRETMEDMIGDWGAFLDISLFHDAIAFFRGGEGNVIKDVEIRKGARVVGAQKISMLNPATAFRISAISRGLPVYEKHLLRLLALTKLRQMQWINFARHDVKFKTLLPLGKSLSSV